MRDRPPESEVQDEQDWQAERALLLEIHRNVEDIINLRAIRLLEILEREDYIGVFRISVLNVMGRGDYRRALDNLRDFVLEESALDKILPELIDNAEPGLALLSKWGQKYRLSALL